MNESKQSQILHNKKTTISIENCDFKKNHVINRFY